MCKWCLVYVYVKIHAQRDKLEVVYRIGKRGCSKLCYSRGGKNSLFISICEVIITREQKIIIAFRRRSYDL